MTVPLFLSLRVAESQDLNDRKAGGEEVEKKGGITYKFQSFYNSGIPIQRN